MKSGNIIREVMTVSNLTQKELQAILNLKSQSSISSMLKSDMRISTFVKLLEVMDCELVVKSKASDKTWNVTE